MNPPSVCRFCGKVFASVSSRNRHERAQHQKKIYYCEKCGTGFNYGGNRTRHTKTCQKQSPHSNPRLAVHKKQKIQPPVPQTSDSQGNRRIVIGEDKRIRLNVSLESCSEDAHTDTRECSSSSDESMNEDADIIDQLGGADVEELEPWVSEDGTIDEPLREIYIQHASTIYREHQLKSPIVHEYNFHHTRGTVTMEDITEQLEYIYHHEDTAFRINMSLGFVLANRETNELRYWYAHNNESVFSALEPGEQAPPMIASRRDLDDLIDRLRRLDFHTNAWQHRDDTKSLLYRVTNTRWLVTKVDTPLGAPCILPDYIRKKRCIVGLTHDYSKHQPYTDNLCLFRCLAFHRTPAQKTKRATEKILRHLNVVPLVNKWKEHTEKSRVGAVQMIDLPKFEALFGININIYQLDREKHATLFYKSLGRHEDTMYLNHFEGHLSYIKKFSTYAGAFQCRNCGMFFKWTHNLHRHETSCEQASNLKYPGGFYKTPTSLHEDLISFGFTNEEEPRKFYKFVCTFDMESILKKISVKSSTGKLTWTTEHQAISVSLCSNVPGFESPKSIVNRDLDCLLGEMFDYLKEIQQKASREMELEFTSILNRLMKEIENIESHLSRSKETVKSDKTKDTSDLDEDIETDDEEARETDEFEPVSEEMLQALKKPNTAMTFFQNIARIGEEEFIDGNDELEYPCSESNSETESIYNSEESDKDDGGDADTEDDASDEEDDNDSISSFISSVSSSDDDDDTPSLYEIPSNYNIDDVPPFSSENDSLPIDDNSDTSKLCSRNYSLPTDVDLEVTSASSMNCILQTEKQVEPSQVVLEYSLKIYRDLLKRVRQHINQLPVLGFNSQKYDINLVKRKLLKHIIENEKSPSSIFIVKKGSAYANIGTSMFKFLDATNYCSPGVSYDKFIKAYGSSLSKSFFPYDWFDDPEKLNYPQLPSYEDFYSTMKGHNVLEAEYASYEKLLTDGLSQEDALKALHIKNVPKTGEQNYADLKDIWQENHMKTFEDFLRFYNNRDVEPFVSALMHMVKFYQEKDIDLFRETQSVPRVARLLLMRSKLPSCHFSLFKAADQDIYKKIRNNIVGGPSIIFRRYHKAGETVIRDGPKKCAKIVGFDANALYLWALSQPMPTGPYTIRKAENGFKKKKQERYLKEWYWLERMAHEEGIHIRHKFNGGQHKVGPFFVDGACGKRVFEFNGCYHHGHDCWMNKLSSDEKRERAEEKFEKTQKRKQFLEQQGYMVTDIFECEYHEKLKENREMQEFMEKFEWPCDKKETMTEKEILEAVIQNQMYGALEVDISVPPHLYDHFKEMSPIFCTSEVPFEDFGEHMQEYVHSNDLSRKPRKLLIGGMKAENILLASDLLKWYISHGLEVTAVHCVIEYDGHSCFEQFVNDITTARLLGDIDPSQACRGDTCKLIGNSAYGSVIMDKLRHLLTCIVQGLAKAQKKVNHRHFRKLDELDDSTFEVQMAKKRIHLDMPHQVGFFILQHAKLRMLQFYYDFLDKFVDRSDFELMEMDTDSLYFALSKNSLEEAVKPELVVEFERVKKEWLPRTDTVDHRRADRRKPGIFKLEAEGSEMAALCSKTYCLFNDATDTVKFSCKGLNKGQFENPMPIYKQVLETGQSQSGTNTGFRTMNHRMHTYHQERLGFSNFYCKRLVNPDGVTTSPLTVTLKPSSD